jgi:hypothetical protein
MPVKRYLKKQQLKNYLRVVAASRTRTVRYYSISGGDDAKMKSKYQYVYLLL